MSDLLKFEEADSRWNQKYEIRSFEMALLKFEQSAFVVTASPQIWGDRHGTNFARCHGQFSSPSKPGGEVMPPERFQGSGSSGAYGLCTSEP